MAFQWIPLELWRASSLQQETRSVIAAYERVAARADPAAMRALRDSIEERVDALENFYVANADDERSVLFETQRLKLRSLLQSFSARRRAGNSQDDKDEAPARPEPAQAAAADRPRIHDDSRLTEEEAAEWYHTVGKREFRNFSDQQIRDVYHDVADGTKDGLVSVRQLRRAYYQNLRRIRSGKRPATASSASGSEAGRGAALIYKWEVDDAAQRAAGAEDLTGSGYVAGSAEAAARLAETEAPVGMPDRAIYFRVRLRRDEFEELARRRRAKRAEDRYLNRIRHATKTRQAKRAAKAAETIPKEAIRMSGPYVEPAALESYIFRSPNQRKWINPGGFVTK